MDRTQTDAHTGTITLIMMRVTKGEAADTILLELGDRLAEYTAEQCRLTAEEIKKEIRTECGILPELEDTSQGLDTQPVDLSKLPVESPPICPDCNSKRVVGRIGCYRCLNCGAEIR